MRRIERIRGRSDDTLIIRGVNVFPSQIDAVLAQEKPLALHYVLELRRPDWLDELDVVVETRTNPALQPPALPLAELERQAEHPIKAYVGVTTPVRVVEPSTIERSQGKAKRILDLRPKT
jgi:phenylacetate-CoA ligase